MEPLTTVTREAMGADTAGQFRQTTAGCCEDTQANLAILPKELAFDFLLFCQRNPSPAQCWT